MDDPGSSKAAFLFTDLDLANTFLDIADTTGVGFIRERNIANARKAHDTVKHFAFRIELTNSERRAIKAELRPRKTAGRRPAHRDRRRRVNIDQSSKGRICAWLSANRHVHSAIGKRGEPACRRMDANRRDERRQLGLSVEAAHR